MATTYYSNQPPSINTNTNGTNTINVPNDYYLNVDN